MGKPRISVIMSVYNGEKYLKQSIESILKQTFADFELIIVDDGSTDNSFTIIRGYDDDRIRVIRNKARIGLTRSLNKALRRARGEYIARQDADDISLPRRFEEQIRFFERHPKTVLLGTSVYLIDEEGKIVGKRIIPAEASKALLEANVIFHGSIMFKRMVIDKIGGYNELFKYSQDYELWLRVSKHFDVNNLQEPLYCHRIHRSGSIGLTKTREQFLFGVLARKIATHELKYDSRLIKLIDQRGINCIYGYLTTREKFLFYESCARSIFSGHLWQNAIGRATLNVYHAIRRKVLSCPIAYE